MHTCLHACACVYMCVCVCVHTCLHACACTCVCVCVCMYACMHVHYICMYVCTCTYVCVYGGRGVHSDMLGCFLLLPLSVWIWRGGGGIRIWEAVFSYCHFLFHPNNLNLWHGTASPLRRVCVFQISCSPNSLKKLNLHGCGSSSPPTKRTTDVLSKQCALQQVCHPPPHRHAIKQPHHHPSPPYPQATPHRSASPSHRSPAGS